MRLLRRMFVCAWIGHDPWPSGMPTGGVDVFCDRCGKQLQERDITPL